MSVTNSISVLIPTFKRVPDLARCLRALENQSLLPDTTIIVVRDTDDDTQSFLKTFVSSLSIQLVLVRKAGVVSALNAGLATASSKILAITDDDAAPHCDWLSKIEQHFARDSELVGVGGRDWIFQDGQMEVGNNDLVGKLLWYGHFVGNHHLGHGEARDVDFLKGVNCAYRTEVLKEIGFDERIRGSTSQHHYELALGIKMRELGWRILYDPSVAVAHYPARRWDAQSRGQFGWTLCVDTVHNETIALLSSSRVNKVVFLLWAFWVGSRRAYGLLQVLRFLPTSGMIAFKYGAASFCGRMLGVKTHLKGEGKPGCLSSRLN